MIVLEIKEKELTDVIKRGLIKSKKVGLKIQAYVVQLKGSKGGNKNIMSPGTLPVLEISFDEAVIGNYFGNTNYGYSNKMREEFKDQISKMKTSIVFE